MTPRFIQTAIFIVITNSLWVQCSSYEAISCQVAEIFSFQSFPRESLRYFGKEILWYYDNF